MNVRDVFTPVVVGGILGFLGLAAGVGVYSRPVPPGPRFEQEALLLECVKTTLSSGEVVWKLRLDRAPLQARLRGGPELDKQLGSWCERKPRVHVVTREERGRAWVQGLVDVAESREYVSERDAQERARRKQDIARSVMFVLLGLAVGSGMLGVFAARRRDAGSMAILGPTRFSPVPAPLEFEEEVPPLHIHPTTVELTPTRPPFVPGAPTAIAIFASVALLLQSFSREELRSLVLPCLLVSAAIVFTEWIATTFPRGTQAMLQLDAQGLKVHLKGGMAEFPFEYLRSVALREERLRRNGLELGLIRTLTLGGLQQEITLEHLAMHRAEDTFEPVLTAVMEAAVDSVRRRLKAGQALRGEDWVLEAQELKLPKLTVPRKQISAARILEDGVHLWKQGQDDAFLKVPLDSSNARLLFRVLTSGVAPQPATSKGSGHQLFRKRSEAVTPIAGVLFGFALMRFAVFLALPPGPHETAGAGVAFLGLGFVLLSWFNRPTVLTVYERSVSLRRWLGAPIVTLRDNEVTELGLHIVKASYEEIHVSTVTELSLRSVNGRRLSFKVNSRHTDEQLRALHDRILEPVTAWLKRLLAEGHTFSWGKKAILDARGLRLSNGRTLDLRSRFKLVQEPEKGLLKITDAWDEEFCSISTSAPNFHAGLRIFEELVEEAQHEHEVGE